MIFNNIHFIRYIHDGIPTKYYISDSGIIYNAVSNKILNPQLSKKGYLRVGIYINNKYYRLSVHRMVAATYLGRQYTNHLDVNHIDGDKQNNYYMNLEWVTRSENIKHAFDNRLKIPKVGDDHSETVYSDGLIQTACQLLNSGISPRPVSEKVGIPISYLYTIMRGESRKQIVNQYLNSDNLHYSKKYRKRDTVLKKEIKRLYDIGYTPKKIKEKLNIDSIHYIYNQVRKSNSMRKGSTTIENKDNYYIIEIN